MSATIPRRAEGAARPAAEQGGRRVDRIGARACAESASGGCQSAALPFMLNRASFRQLLAVAFLLIPALLAVVSVRGLYILEHLMLESRQGAEQCGARRRQRAAAGRAQRDDGARRASVRGARRCQSAGALPAGRARGRRCGGAARRQQSGAGSGGGLAQAARRDPGRVRRIDRPGGRARCGTQRGVSRPRRPERADRRAGAAGRRDTAPGAAGAARGRPAPARPAGGRRDRARSAAGDRVLALAGAPAEAPRGGDRRARREPHGHRSSTFPARSICANSAGASTGCACGWPNSMPTRRASCAMCRTN